MVDWFMLTTLLLTNAVWGYYGNFLLLGCSLTTEHVVAHPFLVPHFPCSSEAYRCYWFP